MLAFSMRRSAGPADEVRKIVANTLKEPGLLIDPPSWFAPPEELRAFLKEAARLDQSDPAVQLSIESVQAALKAREGRAG